MLNSGMLRLPGRSLPPLENRKAFAQSQFPTAAAASESSWFGFGGKKERTIMILFGPPGAGVCMRVSQREGREREGGGREGGSLLTRHTRLQAREHTPQRSLKGVPLPSCRPVTCSGQPSRLVPRLGRRPRSKILECQKYFGNVSALVSFLYKATKY